MREVNELAIEPFARDLLDLEVWMPESETQQLAAGVAGCADDGNREWSGQSGSEYELSL